MPAVFHTMPWGMLFVEEQNELLTRIQYVKPADRSLFFVTEKSPLLHEACDQLNAYAEGRLRIFDLPHALRGTVFQKRVWEELGRIEWGCTRSYGEVARSIGCIGGARAVGMACNRNPLLLVVPCHRVIGADGRLVGFGEGIALKRSLLEGEGVPLFSEK